MTAKNTTVKTTEPFAAGYLHTLSLQAHSAVYDWMRAGNVPAHIFALFEHSMWLANIAGDPAAHAHIAQKEVDDAVLETIKGLCKAGATFGDDFGTWSAALDEVQG